MNPTIKDIARILGVANSTVGRALSGDTRISARMRGEVERVANQIGYIPSNAARSMRGGTTNQVGLVVPDFERNDSATLAKALSESFDEQGFQLVLGMALDDPARELAQLRSLAAARAAGILLIPTASPLPETIMLLQRMPYVQLIRSSRALKSPAFVFDDRLGIMQAAQHLIGLGHTRIGYVGSTEDLSTGAQRLKGFEDAFEKAGLGYDRNLVRTTAPNGKDARAVFTQLIGEHRPTAVIAGGSRITVELAAEIAALGIRVPLDLSFIAFGNQPPGGWHIPGLTSVELPARELALAAGAALLRLIAAVDADGATGPGLYQPQLVVRTSSTRA